MFGWITRKRKVLSDPAKLGKWGEKYCEKFLKTKGLRTLTRNYSCKTGEIDLIMAERDGTVVFVEVKTRADESFQPAETAVNKDKQGKMTMAAKYFLSSHDIDNRPLRFDVVTIVLNQHGLRQIRHYKNVFVG